MSELRGMRIAGFAVWCVVCSTCCWPQSAIGAPPVAASLPAADHVLNQLLVPSTGPIYLGQNVGHANHDPQRGYADSIGALARSTGRVPAILGLDYGYDGIPRDLSAANRLLIEHHRQGGMVTISMHPPNPWRRTGSHDTQRGPQDAYGDLVRPGTAAYRRWHATLDRVAVGLGELQTAGVPVLWRPLHEMNGGWFWWCPGDGDRWPTPGEFRAVWQDMFTYLVREKGLQNLLWVYSAAVQKSANEKPSDYYYPGAELVDVVGLDWYGEDAEALDRLGSYTRLVALGKPLGMTEFGPLQQRDGSFDARTALDLARTSPRLRFVVFWHSWPENRVAIADLKNAAALLTDARAITLVERTSP